MAIRTLRLRVFGTGFGAWNRHDDRCDINSLNLNQPPDTGASRRGGTFRLEILRRNSRARKGLLAILNRGSAHTSFHECQPGAARAGSAVSTLGTGRHVAQADRANFVQLG